MRPYESSSQHNAPTGGAYGWNDEGESPEPYYPYHSTPPQMSAEITSKTYTTNRSGSNRSNRSSRSNQVMKNPKIFQRRVSTRKLEKNGKNQSRVSSSTSGENRVQTGASAFPSPSGEPRIFHGMPQFPQFAQTDQVGLFQGDPTVDAYKQVLPNFPTYNYPEYLTTSLGKPVDVPLCVQEAGEGQGQGPGTQGSRLMPFHAPPNDQYYMQHYYPMMERQALSLNLSPEKILNALRIFIRLVYKTLKAVIIKIRKELDTREIIVDPFYRIPSLPNMDVGCNVCEKTDGDRAMLGLKEENEFSYFEEPDNTPKFITNLWKQLNDWMDMDDRDPVPISRGVQPREPDVFYKVGPFPKDEHGKVELPTFEKVSKKR